jgi:predicted nucleotide-binding protein
MPTQLLPTMFIGSSTEGLEVARSLQEAMANDCVCTVWPDWVFKLGENTMATLLAEVDKYDFAVLVLSADDKVEVRQVVGATPRGNVIFELGLFMGTLGPSRTFPVFADDKDMFIPNDFAGLTCAHYSSSMIKSPDPNQRKQATYSAVLKLRNKISKEGRRKNQPNVTLNAAEAVSSYLGGYPRGRSGSLHVTGLAAVAAH